MTIGILTILFAVATCLGIFGWKLMAGTVYLLSFSLFLAIALGAIPAYLLAYLQAMYSRVAPIEWGQRNVIILLGAGIQKPFGEDHIEMGIFAPARMAKAAALYHACKKVSPYCKILLSGGDPLRLGISEAQIYQSQLRQLGIAPADLMIEAHSLNTYQNAQYAKALVTPLQADRLYLVTSAWHMRRSMLYFSHFGMDVYPVRADWVQAHPMSLYSAWNFVLTDLVLHEYLGIARYTMYNLLGWNPAVVLP